MTNERHWLMLSMPFALAACVTATEEPTRAAATATAATASATQTGTSTPEPTASSVPSVVPDPSATVQGLATLEALYTQIPGSMPQPTRMGGLAEPSSFLFEPTMGETVDALQSQVLRLLDVLSLKTGPDPDPGLEAGLHEVMVPVDELEWLHDDFTCSLEDAQKFFDPVESPSFGPPYSLWLENVNPKAIVWNFAGSESLNHPLVKVVYDGQRSGALYASISLSIPGARLMVHTYPTNTTEPSDQSIRGTVYFRLLDGQWRIALTSVGCQYKIQ